MRKTFFRKYEASRRGYSLTESAVFMGVAGIVLAGVWVATDAVMTEKKASKTLQETAMVVENIHNLYRASPKFSDEIVGQNINNILVRSGVFPAAWQDAEEPGLLRHPWASGEGGFINVTSLSANTFSISLGNNLPKDICTKMALHAKGALAERGLIGVRVHKDKIDTSAGNNEPVDTGDVAQDCDNLALEFKL